MSARLRGSNTKRTLTFELRLEMVSPNPRPSAERSDEPGVGLVPGPGLSVNECGLLLPSSVKTNLGVPRLGFSPEDGTTRGEGTFFFPNEKLRSL